jgi:hypothetical protein
MGSRSVVLTCTLRYVLRTLGVFFFRPSAGSGFRHSEWSAFSWIVLFRIVGT